MAEFSAADAAFTGFRIVWERPLSVLFWSPLQFVVSLSVTLFITVSAGPAFAEITRASFQPGADPGPILARLPEILPTYLVLLVAALVFYAVLSAAMNRAVLRPEQSRFGYLRLASDELRQLGLFAMLAGIAIGLYLAVAIVAGVVLAVLSVVAGVPGVGLALLVLLPLIAAAFIFVGVRLSLASPMTFATARIDLVAAWRLTRGRFWPLFWTYLLACALSFVVNVLTLIIAVFAVAIIGGGFSALGTAAQADMSSIASVLTPANIVYLAITAIGAALSFPITMAPPASVYRALTGGRAAGVSKVFE